MIGVRAVALVAAAMVGGAYPVSGRATQATAGAPDMVVLAPSLVVGPIERVVTPFLLPSGELVVPNRGRMSLDVYGGDGRLVRTLGGAGQLSYVRSAWARGDTLEVFDRGRASVTRFLPDGGTESIAIQPQPYAPSSSGLSAGGTDLVLGTLGAGWVTTSIESVRLGARDQMGVHAAARDGASAGRIAAVEGMLRERYDNGSGPHPLSPTAFYQVLRDTVYVAESLTPSIRVYDAPGTLLREIPIPLPAAQVSTTLAREVVDSANALYNADPGRMPVRWSGLDAPRLSVFWDFIVDELGFIWVRPYDPWQHALALDGLPGGFGGPGGRWLVLSPEAAEMGWIEVPEGLEPVQVTRDAMVGLSRGDGDMQYVRVHPLRRR